MVYFRSLDIKQEEMGLKMTMSELKNERSQRAKAVCELAYGCSWSKDGLQGQKDVEGLVENTEINWI